MLDALSRPSLARHAAGQHALVQRSPGRPDQHADTRATTICGSHFSVARHTSFCRCARLCRRLNGTYLVSTLFCLVPPRSQETQRILLREVGHSSAWETIMVKVRLTVWSPRCEGIHNKGHLRRATRRGWPCEALSNQHGGLLGTPRQEDALLCRALRAYPSRILALSSAQLAAAHKHVAEGEKAGKQGGCMSGCNTLKEGNNIAHCALLHRHMGCVPHQVRCMENEL